MAGFNNGILSIFAPWAKADENEYKEQINNDLESITAPKFDDGAREIETNEREVPYNALMQQMFGNNEPTLKNTRELIDTYRNLMNNYEVDNAVANIVSDAIVYEDDHDVVALNLDGTDFSQNIKDRILDEFGEVLNCLHFQRKGTDHFQRWYVDSRIFFHKIVDPKNLKAGIQELRRLDPRQMQFVREVITKDEAGVKIVKGYKEYFIYDTGHESYACDGRIYEAGTKIKIPRSAIVYAHSGLLSCCGKNIIGYLHRAIKPANQLKLMEDALVIYRITRAPDRRVFYIDTGNMPSRKAAAHMQHIMNTMKNRVVYDATTGKIKNQQHNMSMTEDYWLQRRDGKAVTEVDTMPGATGMSDMDDVRYFRQCLYRALRIPESRIPSDQNSGVMFDAGATISRDELAFAKWIRQLQNKFEEIFLDPLKTNLILKKVITEDEWDKEINNVKVVFNRDSYFTEMKDAEIMERRINMLTMAEPFVGKYISHQTAMKDFLQMSDEQINQEAKQIELESTEARFQNPDEEEEEF
ncbi:portal protein [Enterobacter phage Entb_45]|uniref:portal protein n=1 Tax=Enterobacter phage vB_EclM_Q7622 TaxID=2908628 RepID=UPI0022027252|nr:portal protein [Enterobacter phage vB_EclM_Q7622]UIS65706.1 portal vertex of the head [Enterobacter phage vB_EclM_Q7622]UTY64419.1 portal protein [Enterobacter phage Entb_45]